MSAQISPAGRQGDRIAFVDGLRGIAVLLVVVYHAWWYLHDPNDGAPLYRVPQALYSWLFDGRGDQGVSLFLVLSGFCLSYSLWKRKEAGVERWLVPSEFFARRCLRILPPYYAALLLFTAVSLIGGPHLRSLFFAFGAPPSFEIIVSHLFLMHNMSSNAMAINGVFWSLGLEWQWYWVFPLMLLLCARSSMRGTLFSFGVLLLWLVLCVLMVVYWHVPVMYQWLWTEPNVMLPQRLFEFTCGIVAARRVAATSALCSSRDMSNRMAGVIVVALLPLLLAGWPYLTTFHLQHVLGGFGFALLIVCSHRSSIFSTLLSWRPLVKLGAISYSVYLVHAPVLQVCEYIAYPVLHRYPLLVLWGVASGIAAGATFHLGVEKRCMSRTTWLWLSPVLLRLLRWTDRVYPSPGRKTESGRGRASVRAVASN